MFPVEVCDWDQNRLFTVRVVSRARLSHGESLARKTTVRAHLGILVKIKKQINNTQIEGVATVLLFEPHVNQVMRMIKQH